MRRFRVERIAERITLDAAGSHHLLRVVGIAPGEAVEVFDTAGDVARARLVGVEQGLAVLAIVERVAASPRPQRWLLVGVVRPAAMEIVVRMGTELGLDHLWPVWTERTVRKASERRERWVRIAESAAEQCGRATVPTIASPRPLEEALADVPCADRFIALPGAWTLTAAPAGDAAIVVGPEGGLTPREVDRAQALGYRALALGPHTLRTETAAVAALAWLARGEGRAPS
jgi:16S rRNA (uracil1498-N3)-methyltransferase